MGWFRTFLLIAVAVPLAAQGETPRPPTGTVFTLPDPTSIRAILGQVREIFPGVLDDRANLTTSSISVPGGKRLFWDLLEDAVHRASARVRVLPSGGKIQLLPGGPSRAPTAVSGPFRLSLVGIGCRLDLQTGTPSAVGSLEVVWEPTLHPFFLESRPEGLILEDGAGKKIAGLAEGSAPVPVDGQFGITFDFRLPPLPRTEQTIARMEGKLTAVVPTRMVPITLASLADLEAAPNLDAPILAFPDKGPAGRVTRIVRTKDRWSIQVALPVPPGGAIFESYQSWVVQNEATLRTAAGKVWKSSGYLLEANTPSRSVVTYHFQVRECPEPSDPHLWRFHYTTPEAIVRMDIPFRFRNIPLP